MGGGTEIVQPTPPQPPTASESAAEYAAALPSIFQTQLEYGPKFSQSQFDLQQQFLPQQVGLQQGLQQQYAPQAAQMGFDLQQEFAPQYAQQQQQIQQEFEPEAYAAREQLGGLLGQEGFLSQLPTQQAQSDILGSLGGIADEGYLSGADISQDLPGLAAAKGRLSEDIRSSQSARGLALSGFGAEEEQERLAALEFPYALQAEQQRLGEIGRRQQLGMGLGGLQQQASESGLQRGFSELGRRQNVALSLAGRFGVPNIPSIATPQTQVGQFSGAPNFLQGFGVGNVAQNAAQNYGSFVQGSRPLAVPGQDMGSLIGGIGTGMAGAAILGTAI